MLREELEQVKSIAREIAREEFSQLKALVAETVRYEVSKLEKKIAGIASKTGAVSASGEKLPEKDA